MEVPNQLYNLGDEINGILTIETKRDLGPGRLFVALVCIEEVSDWTTNSRGERRRETDTREIFRYEADVGRNESFSAGTVDRRPFTLRLPLPDTGNAPHDQTPEWAIGLMAVMDTLSSRDRRIWWEVKGRYNIDGLDLGAEQRISVNNYELL